MYEAEHLFEHIATFLFKNSVAGFFVDIIFLHFFFHNGGLYI